MGGLFVCVGPLQRSISDMKVQHLQMVQAVITRMNHNSFLIKGWTITLVAAFLALGVNNKTPRMGIIALVPVVIFWGLDAFYLSQEHCFRRLHDRIAEDIRDNTSSVTLFSMDTSAFCDMASTYLSVAFSRTIVPLYGSLIGIVLIVFFTSS
jgi:hypothetical protein